MKKLSAIAMALALLLMSSPPAFPQVKQTTTPSPPVEPTIVREGDFAIRLVSALDIGTAENETEAETMLASAGIAPKNGWISNYPVTPDIHGELQDAVAAAADSNRLSMGRDEALEVLDSVSADLGLYVLADTSGEYAETPPPASPQYTEPTVINNYYYREGPPVVTYYPPPPDYLYLYAWVPYPFWYTRFFFSGFFILHDFHKVSIIRKRVVVITNHVFHRQHRRFYKIDPVKRRRGRSLIGVAKKSSMRAHYRAEAQRGARSILQRSHDRMASQRRLVNRNVNLFKSRGGFKGRIRTEIARHRGAFRGRTGVREQNSPGQQVQRAHRDSARYLRAPRGSEGRSSSLPSMGKRGFVRDLRKGSKNFSGKVSRKLPGGSALKRNLKLPF